MAPNISAPLSPSNALEGYLLNIRNTADTATSGRTAATRTTENPWVNATRKATPTSRARDVRRVNHEISPLKESIMLNALETTGNATMASKV